MTNNDLVTLIEALLIFRKYANIHYPLHCEHDTLYVMTQRPEFANMSEEDVAILEEYGFYKDEKTGAFYSHRFGSA